MGLTPYQSGQLIWVELQEEYGFREFIWLTGMNAHELITWWYTIDDMLYYTAQQPNIYRLPGNLIQPLDDSEAEYKKYIGLRQYLAQGSASYYIHINNNRDSLLRTSDKTEYKHATLEDDDLYRLLPN